MSCHILVVAAHPDDEVLGCGGTIARHVDRGDVVRVVFLADGVGSREGSGFDSMILARQAAAHKAADVLGIEQVDFLGLPDNQLDRLALLDIVKPIEAIVDSFKPAIVYSHHGGDLNIDHRIASQAVLTACRPQPGAPTLRILSFETLSSTEWAGPDRGHYFAPNCFIGIACQIERKLAALAEYSSEMRPFPHARSLEAVDALARLRGCACGLPVAEAFVLLREIQS